MQSHSLALEKKAVEVKIAKLSRVDVDDPYNNIEALLLPIVSKLSDDEVNSLFELKQISSKNEHYIQLYHLLAKNPDSKLTKICQMHLALNKIKSNGDTYGLENIITKFPISSLSLLSEQPFYQNDQQWRGFLALAKNVDTLYLNWNIFVDNNAEQIRKILSDVLSHSSVKNIKLTGLLNNRWPEIEEEKIKVINEVLKSSKVDTISLERMCNMPKLNVFLQKTLSGNEKINQIDFIYDNSASFYITEMFFDVCCPAILSSGLTQLRLEKNKFSARRNMNSAADETNVVNRIERLSVDVDVLSVGGRFDLWKDASRLFDLNELELIVDAPGEYTSALDHLGHFLGENKNLHRLAINVCDVNNNEYPILVEYLQKLKVALQQSHVAKIDVAGENQDIYVSEDESVRQALFQLISGNKKLKSIHLGAIDFCEIDSSAVKNNFWSDFCTQLASSSVERFAYHGNSYESKDMEKVQCIMLKNASKNAPLMSLKYAAAVTVFKNNLNKKPGAPILPIELNEFISELEIGIMPSLGRR